MMADRVSIRVPATSANLGCLFDCAALALGLYLDVRVARRADLARRVSYRGANPERVPTDETNLIARTISSALPDWQQSGGFDLEIDNQIPVGVGLGSSAAAIVSALAAAHWLGDETLTDEQLVTAAAHLDGHPDNVAAAWEGGFTVAFEESERVRAFSCPVPDSLRFVLVVPDYAVPTEQARAVLPAQYARADAVHNLQCGVVTAVQFFSGRVEFEPAFFRDRWHQPYRAALVPGLAEALRYTHQDLAGICLSGAGPALLGIVTAPASSEYVGRQICALLGSLGVTATHYILAADNRGAKGWSAPA